MSLAPAPRARRAAAFIRAAMAALTACSIVAATPASAVVIRDASGKFVLLPPAAPQPEYPRKEAEQMAGDCADRTASLTDMGYTRRELAGAALDLLMIAHENRATGETQDKNFASADSEFNFLISAALELERCMYEVDMIDLSIRALDSCEQLLKAVDRSDAYAGGLFKRNGITVSQWVRSLERFLPAAQSCRNKLGRCYNPNNESQTQALRALIRLEISLKFTSERKALLTINIPTCTKTMVKAGLDKPNRDDRPEIEYINMMAGDDFISVGGEGR